ncbi:hypothetical protein V5799_024352 [Amblyomma americanum]|uniref:Uncharacterized protein n=1 Tax=Amblyomma americanum TaxID=6943 RepID=A0AAQ4ECU1_AMBAM
MYTLPQDPQQQWPGEQSQGSRTTVAAGNTVTTQTYSSSPCKERLGTNTASTVDPLASPVGAPASSAAKDDVVTPMQARTAMPEPARRRETSLPNLNAVPAKPALARRTLSLTSSEKRARFLEIPIVEMLLLSVTQQTSGTKSLVATVVAAVAATATFVLAAILFFALFVHSDEGEDTPGACSSADCRHHAALITDRINRSLDPCQDFAAFACSAWSPPPASAASSRRSQSALDDVVRDWALDFESVLVTGSR